MTREEQLKIYEEVNQKLTNLSKSKGEDYAGEDVLSNFKNLADACKALQIDITTPVGVSLFFQVHKIARISNLLQSGKIPNNEGIDDSFLDDINYAIFGYLNWLDQNKEKYFDELKGCLGIDKQPEVTNGVLMENIDIFKKGTGKIIQPCSYRWDPKEDITTYELAQAVPYLIGDGLFLPGQYDLSQSFWRHFKIHDPNQ